MGLPWPTSFVSRPELAVRLGPGTPLRRSIWPKAVWESPTVPYGRQPVRTGSFHKQNTKPEILCFSLTHLPASPLRLLGYQSQGGRSRSGLIPRTFGQLRAPVGEQKGPGARALCPGWDQLPLGEAEELAHLSASAAWEGVPEKQDGAGFGA